MTRINFACAYGLQNAYAAGLSPQIIVHENKNVLIDLTILVVLLGIGVAGYWYSPLLLPKADIAATPMPGCNLNETPCSAQLPDGARIELSLEPRPIPLVQPLRLAVRSEGLAADKVEIDFAGINMNMGYLRPQLNALGNNRFEGETALPVCVTGAMAWQATVLIETARQRIAIPFRFDAQPH